MSERIESEARDWLILLSSGEASASDIARFREWQRRSGEHARIFERERAIWKDVGKLAAQLRRRPVRTSVSRRMVLRGGLALTAAAGGAVILPEILLRMRSDYRTAYGEQQAVTLPDGTGVLLNTGTAIALDFGPERRGVRLLQGEALFHVEAAGSQPFSVAAGYGLGRATFGEFALRFEGDHAQVTAADADVEILSPSAAATPVHLAPAHRIAWRDGAAPEPVTPVDIAVALAWREGRIVFEGEAFPRAAEELARYLPETVILRGNANRPGAVSGSFATGDARDALTALAQTQGLSVRRIPGVALIVS